MRISVEEALHEVLLHKGSQQCLGGGSDARALLQGLARAAGQNRLPVDPLQHQHALAAQVLHHLRQAQPTIRHKARRFQ